MAKLNKTKESRNFLLYFYADTQEQLVKNWQDLKVACFQYSQRLYDVMSPVCELRSIISKLLSVEEESIYTG